MLGLPHVDSYSNPGSSYYNPQFRNMETDDQGS